jgi:hypothetical protein
MIVIAEELSSQTIGANGTSEVNLFYKSETSSRGELLIWTDGLLSETGIVSVQLVTKLYDKENAEILTEDTALYSQIFLLRFGYDDNDDGDDSNDEDDEQIITPIPGEDDPDPKDPDDEPSDQIIIDDGDGEEPPAVIVPLDPALDIDIDTNTGVETVTVREGAPKENGRADFSSPTVQYYLD